MPLLCRLGPGLSNREQIDIKLGTNIHTKSWKTCCRKTIGMLVGLKVSCLPCKYVFYKPELYSKEAPGSEIEF